MTQRATRDRILDALSTLLIDKGSSAVTLEAVAARAGVSKGGLLYHFGSKQALITGLARRLADEADEEFAEAERSPEGVTPVFLATSLPQSSDEAALYLSLTAALRSKELATDEAVALIRRIFSRWSELLRADIGDPVLAETIRLVGDGLYLSAIADLPLPDDEILRQVMDRLTEQAAIARRARTSG
jgi:AcrR family transcriptional regulator